MSTQQNKTQPTDAPVESFINSLADEQQRKDSAHLVALMRDITGNEPVMWGPSIIGFGAYHYKYESGREGDMPAVGFSPRKGNLSIYVLDDANRQSELLEKLGPHKTGKVCLYVKRLSDVDLKILKQLIRVAYDDVMSGKYGVPQSHS